MKVRAEFRGILLEMGYGCQRALRSGWARRRRAQLRGDAHQQLRRELVLELRRAVPAAAAPRAGLSRHLLLEMSAPHRAAIRTFDGCADSHRRAAPSSCTEIPDAKYLESVKTMHEKGGFGSIGYRYSWSEAEARKNILVSLRSRMRPWCADAKAAARSARTPRPSLPACCTSWVRRPRVVASAPASSSPSIA
jgi:hypothetical protein